MTHDDQPATPSMKNVWHSLGIDGNMFGSIQFQIAFGGLINRADCDTVSEGSKGNRPGRLLIS